MEWTNQDIAAVAAGLFIGVLFIGCVAVLAAWMPRLGEGAWPLRVRRWPAPPPRERLRMPPRVPRRDTTESPLASKPYAYYTVTTHVPLGAKLCPCCGHPLPTEKVEG